MLARAMRVNFGTFTTTTALTALKDPGPNIATTAMASNVAGKAKRVSMIRIITASDTPPK